jgi:hypothetical protein
VTRLALIDANSFFAHVGAFTIALLLVAAGFFCMAGIRGVLVHKDRK